jgi:hypothetical protein
MSRCSTRYEQPYLPLEPKPRLTRTLVEFDPRKAPVPKVKSRHGSPPQREALPGRSREWFRP